MDRRLVLAGGLGLGIVGPLHAASSRGRKRAAIEGIRPPEGFNGVMAFARNGRVEHARFLGMADVEAGRPVAAETRFKWGSASKWLTSAAVLRLVERGRLSLDAPIVTYLPDFRRDTGERVRVEHLLSNTSGIPDLLSRQLRMEPSLRFSDVTPQAIVARFAGGDLAFEPGRGWDYAAINWAIVAALVQRVTGKPLPTVVSEQVLLPLAMAHTGFAQSDQPAMPDLAAAYTGGRPAVRKMLPVPPFLAASGNAASTVADAARAANGIFNGGLLSRASRDALTGIRWPDQDYALGGRVHRVDGVSWAWETGKVEGYRAHIAHDPLRGETVIVFNNTDLDQSVIGAWVEQVIRA